MSFFEDLKLVYSKASKDTLTKIKSSPLILIVPFLYGIIYSLAMIVFGNILGMVSGVFMGFLMPVITSLILSSYFSILSDLIYYNRISFRNFKDTFKSYFASIYSVYFILIIISWIIPVFGGNLILAVIINLIINPIAESIYIRGEYYTSAYTHSFEFMKENFCLWVIPYVVYLLILHLIGFDFVSTIASSSVIDIPLGENLVNGIYYKNLLNLYNIRILLATIVTAIYAVFRGNLCKILQGSTRRKRAYMGEI